MFISFYSFSQNNINEVITVFDNSILSIIDKNAKIEVLGDNFRVAEGPLWDDNENKLIFTDVDKIRYSCGVRIMVLMNI